MKSLINRIPNIGRPGRDGRIERRLESLGASARSVGATHNEPTPGGEDRWELVLKACGSTSAAVR